MGQQHRQAGSDCFGERVQGKLIRKAVNRTSEGSESDEPKNTLRTPVLGQLLRFFSTAAAIEI